MTVWASAVFQRDEQPTDTNAGAFTTQTPVGLFAVKPPLAAIYPIGQAGGGTIGFATGASVAIMRKP